MRNTRELSPILVENPRARGYRRSRRRDFVHHPKTTPGSRVGDNARIQFLCEPRVLAGGSKAAVERSPKDAFPAAQDLAGQRSAGLRSPRKCLASSKGRPNGQTTGVKAERSRPLPRCYRSGAASAGPPLRSVVVARTPCVKAEDPCSLPRKPAAPRVNGGAWLGDGKRK